MNFKVKFLCLFFSFFGLIGNKQAFSQFDGPAGSPGSKAIFKDSSIFVNWANGCQIKRGLKNISQPDSGLADVGNENAALGKAGENGVVSLGDSGVAPLTFPNPLRNGPGPDFAVFENAFQDDFLELAFVEVSSDGNRFVRFPAISNTQSQTQIGPFEAMGQPEKIYNLAGKYRAFFGTPFDLEELKDSNGLDVSKISHVRLVDVVGSVDSTLGSRDALGHLINDPFPTAFPSGGFDLDAIGVIHENKFNASIEDVFSVYPNPASDVLQYLTSDLKVHEFFLLDQMGKKMLSTQGNKLSLNAIKPGFYFAVLSLEDKKNKVRIIWKL